jgi:hypothetical protein
MAPGRKDQGWHRVVSKQALTCSKHQHFQPSSKHHISLHVQSNSVVAVECDCVIFFSLVVARRNFVRQWKLIVFVKERELHQLWIVIR